MADSTIPISEVPKDIDPNMVGSVTNPTKEDFSHSFNKQEVTLKAGETKMWPLPMAIHIAYHLCDGEVRKAFKARVNTIKDDKKKEEESRKSIGGYKEKILEMMKTIVETESDYLEKVNAKDLR